MKDSLLLVTHGLISNQDGLTLHPDLLLWQEDLAKRKQQWFESPSYTPLDLYAAIVGSKPAGLLARALQHHSARQYWLASPYHAQLTRDAVRVMPKGMLPWCEEDAVWICELLNPLLKEEGMSLHTLGAALLLACDEALDAQPASFADIAGGYLPNSHPEGRDGGHMMRLMAEIQMLLKLSPAEHRRQRGEADVHGLWFWHGCETPRPQATCPSVATRDSCLASLVDGKDARIIITEPEQLAELVRQGADLPCRLVLLGSGYALSLKKSLFFKFAIRCMKPKSVKDEDALLQVLRGHLHTV